VNSAAEDCSHTAASNSAHQQSLRSWWDIL